MYSPVGSRRNVRAQSSLTDLLQLTSPPVAITFAEAYFAVPGAHLDAIEQSLGVVVRANEQLEAFHRARAAAPTA
jgi:hypothetical protein